MHRSLACLDNPVCWQHGDSQKQTHATLCVYCLRVPLLCKFQRKSQGQSQSVHPPGQVIRRIGKARSGVEPLGPGEIRGVAPENFCTEVAFLATSDPRRKRDSPRLWRCRAPVALLAGPWASRLRIFLDICPNDPNLIHPGRSPAKQAVEMYQKTLLGPSKSCWETFYIFASCGLVVEIQPLNCENIFQRQPSQVRPHKLAWGPSGDGHSVVGRKICSTRP